MAITRQRHERRDTIQGYRDTRDLSSWVAPTSNNYHPNSQILGVKKHKHDCFSDYYIMISNISHENIFQLCLTNFYKHFWLKTLSQTHFHLINKVILVVIIVIITLVLHFWLKIYDENFKVLH